jgi:transglutaminase-like putative cysteine protease
VLNRLSALPRETRDTLFLLAVIAWVILPQVSELPWWCASLAALVLAWRGTLALRAQALPGKWWLIGLLAVTIAATLYTYRTLLGQGAGVTLIVVLLALKTLELRARRDAFVVFFLGFFMMLTNFFHSQSLLTAASMLIGLLGLLTALVNAHMPVGRPPLWHAARTAGWMVLLGAPIMAVLFLLFPRVAPLWGVPGDALSGRSGLSPTMQVGGIAKLALDDSIALRIRFDGPVPPAQDLYFRGPVLSSFDGREWAPLRSGFPPRLRAPADLRVSGAPVRYEVTLEQNNRPWLFVMEAAGSNPELPGWNVGMTSELQWLTNRPVTEAIRYRAESYPVFSHGPTQKLLQLQDYIELPPGFNPRTLALAAQMRRDPQIAQDDTMALVNAVLQRLRTGGYSYTLEPGVYGANSADEFWFDRKEGFCEHIASAFVILMRALDIPARVVTGYQGGDRNPVDGYWAVRQRDAHAWAEIWQAGRGWVRVDPTAAVEPNRVITIQRLLAPQGALASAMSNLSPGLMVQLRAGWEALNNAWTQRVLNYSQGTQFKLLQNLGFETPGWEDLSYVLIAIVVFVSLCGAAWTLWERAQHDPWLALLGAVRRRLAQSGLELAATSAPRQMATSVQARWGEQTAALQAWLLRLEALRYARQPADNLAQLRREFKSLTWPP